LRLGSENLNPSSTGAAKDSLGACGTGTLPSGRLETKVHSSRTRHFGGDLTNLTNIPDGHQALRSSSTRTSLGPLTLASRRTAAPVGTRILDGSERGDLPASKKDPKDPQVSDYIPAIIADLYKQQAVYMPRPDFLECQPEINGKMRAILVDWLVEVHSSLKLHEETLHLTVNVVDRHLDATPVPRKQFQLVGMTALLLASKFEEIDPPQIKKLVWVSDNSYTKEDVLLMECTMLKALGFELKAPTPAQFLDYLLGANDCDGPRHECLVKYFLELALVEAKMTKFMPSVLVSAALHLSNEVLGRVAWPEKMAEISTHTQAELQSCVHEMRALLKAAPTCKQQAVRKKYLKEKYHFVASFPVTLTGF